MSQPTRRRFLKRAALAAAGVGTLGTATAAYGLWEASSIRLRRATVAVPNLPGVFAGKTVCLMADLHHGPYVGIRFVREAVRRANALRPDLFALPGDFAADGRKAGEQLAPCLEALSALRAPLGVFAVPGNHDMRDGGACYRACVGAAPALTDVTNASVRLTLGGSSLYIAGVDDLWWGRPDLPAALRGVPDGSAVVLLSHNPDFAETRPDARVGLVLSGHTHGGQVYVPGTGSGLIPSRYGDKYRAGLVRGPKSSVYVTRGLGESGLPVRLNCPPEINLLTLVAG